MQETWHQIETSRTKTGQKGFTQLLEGSRKAVARAKNLDVHVKHCFEVCRYVKGMPAGKAISHLEEVLLIDSDRKDIRAKARAIPYTLGSGNLRRREAVQAWLVTERVRWVLEDIL